MTRTQTNPDLEVVVRNWIVMLRPRSSLSFNCYRAMSVLQREGLFRGPPPPPFVRIDRLPTPRLDRKCPMVREAKTATCLSNLPYE